MLTLRHDHSALEGGYSHGNLCLAKMDLDPGAIGVDTTEGHAINALKPL